MQCFFLFRDAQGRLPSAKELKALGFAVSDAVLPAKTGREEREERPRALAAEPVPPYGRADAKKPPGSG